MPQISFKNTENCNLLSMYSKKVILYSYIYILSFFTLLSFILLGSKQQFLDLSCIIVKIF